MGYRMSRQRSLGGYSPYFLLFGRGPIGGASVRDVLQRVVDLDSPAEWARLINERAKVFEKHMPIAFNNLAVAQHQDMLRYTKTRSGTFTPKLQWFVTERLRLPEAAEDRLVGPEGRSFSSESQVSRQWGPLGSRGT
jgi:hypothetical protein